MPRDPVAEARRLEALLAQLSSMTSMYSAEFPVWRDEVALVLKRTYGEDSEEYARFASISFDPGLSSFNWEAIRDAFERGAKQTDIFMKARIDELTASSVAGAPQPASMVKVDISNGKVFIVHGHDHGMKETVARYLSKVGVEPIILHEQADEAQTIIEKFEQHADVSFAVTLFSKDDLGVSNIDAQKSSESIESVLRSRARQNVVFECGYFIGRLGRKRVAVLHAEGVEMMSDYSGVVYIPFDAGDGWRLKLFKELKVAGFDLDANKIF
ncbi:MAG TPA: nucleotide-binding protein [Candidatus Angelobacter sp.]|jgi:predicted nucleotide-binding protein|nr:nucleotide-binding protein [Candidatus Angelobacter sp.]